MPHVPQPWVWAAFVIVVTVASGSCSNRVKPDAVGLDPVAVAQSIVQQFDTDGDSALSKSELKASESLSSLNKNTLSPLDADADGSVSKAELEAKIQAFVDVNRVKFRCQILHGGRPLREATVRFIPEPFMGPTLTEAHGTTDENGMTEIEDGGEFGGMVSGLYRVEVTHPMVKISPQLNTQTTLGAAVDGTNPYAATATFHVR
jgi:hypothetical protein